MIWTFAILLMYIIYVLFVSLNVTLSEPHSTLLLFYLLVMSWGTEPTFPVSLRGAGHSLRAVSSSARLKLSVALN